MIFDDLSWEQRQACKDLAEIAQYHEIMTRRREVDDEVRSFVKFRFGEVYKKMDQLGFTWCFQNNISCLAERDPYAYGSSVVNRALEKTRDDGTSLFKEGHTLRA